MSKRYLTRSQTSKINSLPSSVVITPPDEIVIEIDSCREVSVPVPPAPKPLSRSVRFTASQTSDAVSQTDDTSQDLYNECLAIETFVHCAKVEDDRCRRLAVTLQMYHYLENHHLYMKASSKFKEMIGKKIQEYITVSDMEEEVFQIMSTTPAFLEIPENRKKYLKQHEIVVLCKLLKESCQRLKNILESL
jgi:hypothetical protein